MNQITKALALSKQAITLVKEEINRHNRGSGTVGTIEQLLGCEQQLGEMIAQLESGKLPPKAQRLCGMGRMVADSWPTDARLGDSLLVAEQTYRSA